MAAEAEEGCERMTTGKYVAGLDGGGTKTAVCIADEQGRVVGSFASGPINYNGQDAESVRETMAGILAEIAAACGGLDRCVRLCIGAAGVSNPAVVPRLTAVVRESGYAGGLDIAGDIETALWGAHEGRPGLILIAGTGSVCYGRNAEGEVWRAGGYGHLIDDEGSGYSIGRELLSAVVRAADGRAPETAITQLVYGQLGFGSVPELIAFVYDRDRNKKDIAALAPLLSDACGAGDEAALGIAERSADGLLELVAPVAERLGLHEGALAAAGSVLLRNAHVRERFEEKLRRRYPRLQCRTAKHEPSYGAVLMALRRLKAEEGAGT